MPLIPLEQAGDEGEATHARRSSVDHSQPQLEAQSMYPRHPLLNVVPRQGWFGNDNVNPTDIPLSNVSHAVKSTSLPSVIGNTVHANEFAQQYTSSSMRVMGSDQGYGSSSMGRDSSLGSLSNPGNDFGSKKRACDQCNHSKVRCDFSDPCCAFPDSN